MKLGKNTNNTKLYCVVNTIHTNESLKILRLIKCTNLILYNYNIFMLTYQKSVVTHLFYSCLKFKYCINLFRIHDKF